MYVLLQTNKNRKQFCNVGESKVFMSRVKAMLSIIYNQQLSMFFFENKLKDLKWIRINKGYESISNTVNTLKQTQSH